MRLENLLHQRPRLGAAAGHHRRTEPRAFFAARHARADEEHALALQVLGAADGIRKVRVAAIDDQVAGFQVRQQHFDEIVHRLPRLHHQHDLARPLQQPHHLFDRMRADDGLAALGGIVEEFVHFRNRAIVGHYRLTVIVHIEDEILTHHGEADQCDICGWFHAIFL